MNKILMGTSALVLAGAFGAGEAKAATWDLDWRGYYEASIAYRDSDRFSDTEEGVDVLTDSELQFRPKITLDNGLQFGVNIELETDADVDQNVDDTYAFVEGSFGVVRLGHTNAAGAEMQGSAPDVSWVGASSGSLAGYVGLGGDEFTGTFVQPGGGDVNKIAYFTPRFSGFQLGASYAHDGSPSKDAPSGGGFEDLMSVAANYKNSFGAFGVSTAASYSTASGTAPGAGDHDHYAVHMTLTYAGFSFGGSYANNDNEISGDDHDFYDAGIAYRTGPWGVSFQYSHGESNTNSDDMDQYLAAVNYELGPGVNAGAYAGYVEADAGGSDVDGFIVGTGFKLNF